MNLKSCGNIWTGLIWLTSGSSDRLLWSRYLTFVPFKIRGICWIAEQLLCSEQFFHSVTVVSTENSTCCTASLLWVPFDASFATTTWRHWMVVCKFALNWTPLFWAAEITVARKTLHVGKPIRYKTEQQSFCFSPCSSDIWVAYWPK